MQTNKLLGITTALMSIALGACGAEDAISSLDTPVARQVSFQVTLSSQEALALDGLSPSITGGVLAFSTAAGDPSQISSNVVSGDCSAGCSIDFSVPPGATGMSLHSIQVSGVFSAPVDLQDGLGLACESLGTFLCRLKRVGSTIVVVQSNTYASGSATISRGLSAPSVSMVKQALCDSLDVSLAGGIVTITPVTASGVVLKGENCIVGDGLTCSSNGQPSFTVDASSATNSFSVQVTFGGATEFSGGCSGFATVTVEQAAPQ